MWPRLAYGDLTGGAASVVCLVWSPPCRLLSETHQVLPNSRKQDILGFLLSN